MNRLSLDQVLKDNNTRDPNSISSLTLTHRALSDVSCLSEFKNLERLDLSSNMLTSLEGLKSCVNLKWLSVSQNKLESLKGIEGLTKLTVLNAAKNKLTVMDEIKPIVSLRALILNDNEIASICRLEQMKELNTLVLSKNPIRDIGDSLMNAKSITKLSLSHCQLQSIQSSFKSCAELKELRLAHNDIAGLPAELAHNKRLQTLDLGNNAITRWSELKVLDSLVRLNNLNLQGNPVAEKDKLAKKIKKMLPNLRVLNARPLDKYTKNEKGGRVDAVDDSSHHVTDERGTETDEQEKRDVKLSGLVEIEDGSLANAGEDKKRKQNRHKANENVFDQEVLVHGDEKVDGVKKKKSKAKQKSELDIIDDSDTSFLELFSDDKMVDTEKDGKNKVDDMPSQVNNMSGGIVTFTSTKSKKRSIGSTLPMMPVNEIGAGGPSTWDQC